MMRKKMVGVFGGSFDPPHMGHRALVEVAKERLKLDEVWVIPVGLAVHRSLTSGVAAAQRLQWVETAFSDLDYVKVLSWEVDQVEAVPTIETMRRVVSMLDTVPCWLMGMDVWRSFPSWIAYPEHLALCNVVVLDRSGESLVMHEAWKRVETLNGLPAGHVCYLEVSLPAVSATQIRQTMMAGQEISTGVDERIKNDIRAAYVGKVVMENV